MGSGFGALQALSDSPWGYWLVPILRWPAMRLSLRWCRPIPSIWEYLRRVECTMVAVAGVNS